MHIYIYVYINSIHTSQMWMNGVEHKHQAVKYPSHTNGIPCEGIVSDIICQVAQYPTQKYRNMGCKYWLIVSCGLPSPDELLIRSNENGPPTKQAEDCVSGFDIELNALM